MIVDIYRSKSKPNKYLLVEPPFNSFCMKIKDDDFLESVLHKPEVELVDGYFCLNAKKAEDDIKVMGYHIYFDV